MNKKNYKSYGPNERGYLESKPREIKSYSKYDSINLPDPVTDPIISNDIATSEFNYTYNCEEDIWGDDYLDDMF